MPVLEGLALRGYGVFGAASAVGAYDSIITAYPVNTTSVVFNVPSGYKSLEFRMFTVGGTVYEGSSMYFNSDTAGSNYTLTAIDSYNTAGTARSTSYTTQSYSLWAAGGSTTQPGYSILQVYDYDDPNKTTTWKTIGVADDANAATGYVSYIVGMWKNTSRVTTITMNLPGQWKTGTAISLYGLRG
jgi:hypothetical protein